MRKSLSFYSSAAPSTPFRSKKQIQESIDKILNELDEEIEKLDNTIERESQSQVGLIQNFFLHSHKQTLNLKKQKKQGMQEIKGIIQDSGVTGAKSAFHQIKIIQANNNALTDGVFSRCGLCINNILRFFEYLALNTVGDDFDGRNDAILSDFDSPASH